MYDNFNRMLGERVRQYRDYKHISREKFAEQADISSQFLADIESGKKGMSALTLYKVAKVLNVSCDFLLTATESPDCTPHISKMLGTLESHDLQSAELILQTFVDALTRKK